MADLCMACGNPDCPGRVAVDFCSQWQEAEARRGRGEYLTTQAVIWSCPECGTDLRDWWCSWCERLWSPQAVADWDDPPDYQHPEDDHEV